MYVATPKWDIPRLDGLDWKRKRGRKGRIEIIFYGIAEGEGQKSSECYKELVNQG